MIVPFLDPPFKLLRKVSSARKRDLRKFAHSGLCKKAKHGLKNNKTKSVSGEGSVNKKYLTKTTAIPHKDKIT